MKRKLTPKLIGACPAVFLRDAREKARELLRDIELGLYGPDGGEVETEQVPTLGEVVPQFIELYAKPRNRDCKGTERVLEKFSPLFSKRVDEIKRGDVHRVLDGITMGGAPVRANRALAAIKKLMNWCVDRGMIELSPVASLKPPTKETARERVLTDGELIACWHAVSEEGFPFSQFVQLLTLTGQRRGEVSGMRWSELDFDKAVWTIPSDRAKNGSEHIAPSASLAIDTLTSVPRFQGSDFVFTTTGRSPISGFGRLKKRIDIVKCVDR